MRLAAAVDIGGTRTKLGIVGARGALLAQATVSTSPRGAPAPLVDAIVAGLAPLLAAHRVDGVGVSVAGFLDAARGAMVGNANLPELCGFPLRRTLEERLSLPCVLEVDSNASTIAEFHHGGGQGARRLLGVAIGTGLGGGVIVDGRVLRYTGECAGDLGHVIVAPREGRRCSCGARGCLEAMVCSRALAERSGNRPVRAIVSAARAGEETAIAALAETGRWLGLGLASLSPLFAPDRIVVGGGVATAGDLLLDPARASYREHVDDAHRDSVTIVGSLLEGWEGLIGAGHQFLQPMP